VSVPGPSGPSCLKRLGSFKKCLCSTCYFPVTAFNWMNLLPFLYISFVRVIRSITNRMCAFFWFTWADCPLTIITLIHWIKIDHVLLQMTKIDSLGNCPLSHQLWDALMFMSSFLIHLDVLWLWFWILCFFFSNLRMQDFEYCLF